jgi:hypothetical protein
MGVKAKLMKLESGKLGRKKDSHNLTPANVFQVAAHGFCSLT